MPYLNLHIGSTQTITQYYCYYYYYRLTALWISTETTQVSRYQKGKTRKVKTNLDLLEQEIVSSIGISWAICKSAPRPRHITTAASHHIVFTGQMPFLLPNQ